MDGEEAAATPPPLAISQLDIRIGRIVEISKHPDADSYVPVTAACLLDGCNRIMCLPITCLNECETPLCMCNECCTF